MSASERERARHQRRLSATVMTAHFPASMFPPLALSELGTSVAPPTATATCSSKNLLYLPAKLFMDSTGGLSVVLLRDDFPRPGKEGSV